MKLYGLKIKFKNKMYPNAFIHLRKFTIEMQPIKKGFKILLFLMIIPFILPFLVKK
jgi:hypothetical protein